MNNTGISGDFRDSIGYFGNEGHEGKH